MAEVLHGNAGANQLNATKDKTQVYALAGNDTLISDNKSEILLVGGSGDDSLIMLGGNGTLNGGKGEDTFELNYSATQALSAVIEDLNPSEDKIIVNFDGASAPQISSEVEGNDVVLSDGDKLNVTLKGVRDNDYFDGSGNAEQDNRLLEILRLTNIERETKGLSALTMSDGLIKAAEIRAAELKELDEEGKLDEFKHDRPNNLGGYSTVFDEVGKHYQNSGENIHAGSSLPSGAMSAWIGSPSHYKNILSINPKTDSPIDYVKLGVGFDSVDVASASSQHYYWEQLFGGSLSSGEMETISTADLLTASTEVYTVSKAITLTESNETYSNTLNGATISGTSYADSIKNTGLFVSINGNADNDTIDNKASFATINAGTGNDSIKLSGDANLIQYRAGDGFDTVSGFNSTDTLSISDDEYTPVTIGNDVFVNVGSASIKLSDAATLPTFNIEGRRSKLFILRDEDDVFNNTVDSATIQALGGDDNITNSGKNVLFFYESGDDTIKGFNSTSTLKIAQDTATSLNSNGNLVLTVDTGKITLKDAAGLSSLNIVNSNGAPIQISDAKDVRGDDTANTLNNDVDDATIQAFGGDDTITNSGNNVSIVAGEGNDLIRLSGSAKKNLIEYREGDDSDTVIGFDANDTLRIGDGTGTYSTQKSGNDVVVTVGDGKITLTGAASLSSVKIDGKLVTNGGGSDTTTPTTPPEPTPPTTPANPKFITLAEDNATYYNTVDGATIQVLGVNDRIYNGYNSKYKTIGGNSVSIKGGAGDDSIDNFGDSVTINGGAGNDSIGSKGDSVKIDGGDGDDYIFNYEREIWNEETEEYEYLNPKKATINGGAGNDEIYNGGDSVTISGGADNDSIDNLGDSVTIDGGADNDSIYNLGDSVTIDGGAGNDSISNGSPHSSVGSSVTIDAGAGDDSIDNFGDSVTIDGGADDDSIYNWGGRVTIDGGTDNDSIYNEGESVTIDGGAGDDDIRNLGSSVTIDGGDSNDYIDNWSDNVTINGGNGNDSIDNWSDNVTINGGNGNDSIGNKYYTTIAEELIEHYSHNVSISGGEGDDYILTGDFSVTGVTADGGSGNDEIYNRSAGVSINGGDGNDTISNDDGGGVNSTLIGGAGDDFIRNSGNSVTIDGGAGNDYIVNYYGSNVSVLGGTGDDQISLMSAQNNYIRYELGDGNDTVWGMTENDTLNLPEPAELNVANSKLTSLSNAQGDLIIRVRTNGVVTGEVRIVGGIKHPPKFTFGESNASGGISGDGNGGSSSGNGGGNGGGNDGGKTSGGKSTSEGINSEATVGKSAVGSTGKNTSTETGGNDKPRNIPSTSKNYPSVGNKRASVEGEFHNLSDVLNRWANSVQENTENTVETGITNFGVITGTENADLLSAPEVGSTLWGGSDNVSDTLVGNVGADVLIGGKTQGADFFLNTSSADVIYLNDTTLNDIIGAGENNGIITLLFDNGNFVNVQSTEALSPSFILSDGTSYRYDNTTKSWGVTQYVYPGNNMTISDYESDKSILFRADYAGAFFDDAGNFVAYSSTGALIVQNAADKVININDYAGNPCFKAYAASTSGVIDGRGISGFEIINGSAGADMIYAGDGGSQLWGGFGDASDTLIGGGGTDIFIGGKNQGVDLFLDASSSDIVHLNDATLSDIVATEENNGAIAVAFNNGNVIAAQSSEVTSATFMLADGSAYRYDHANKSWQTA